MAVGDLGTVILTEDAGQTWETQPNITSNILNSVVYFGGSALWVGGQGGTILKRSAGLSTVRTTTAPIPPFLKFGRGRDAELKEPKIRIVDDGDIPQAVKKKK